MANSKLLKQAIADAKAVKETALANAKLALEEAFTPRLQSILSQKLRAEAEGADMEDSDDDAMQTEELESSEIGTSDMAEPEGFESTTEFEPGSTETESGQTGSELDDYQKIKDLLEGEDDMDDMDDSNDMDDDMDEEDYEVTGEEPEESDEDEMDLEAIIKELEDQLSSDDSDVSEEYGDDMEAGDQTDEEVGSAMGDDSTETDEVIDLEEILREMESDMMDTADEKMKSEAEEEKKELEKNLQEAYDTIKSLQSTINEVNLLNAKLLFANKLFRAHNMTNEQKVKVIETLDRTKSVREVKLVYATLAENLKYTSNASKVAKKSITEGIASKPVKSTKPAVVAQKQVISENADFANRFKKLAGIIK
jgi:hypothetical protein